MTPFYPNPGIVLHMRIVLATPLYPPDIADPAPYTYELAKRLSTNHEVIVVTYGRLPEELPRVTVRTIDKRLPTLSRGWGFYKELSSVLPNADVLYLQSGISAEFPALFVRHHARIFWRKSEEPKHQSFVRKVVEFLTKRHARIVESDPALTKPEILPFEPRPEGALVTWERMWDAEIKKFL
jgi:hypothetical protein